MHVGFVVLLVFVVSCTCSNYQAFLEHRCLFLIETRCPRSFWHFVFTKSYTVCHICLLNPAFLFCTLHCQSPKAPVDNPLIGYHSQHIHPPIESKILLAKIDEGRRRRANKSKPAHLRNFLNIIGISQAWW